jgi:hypothetical protein
MVQKCWLIAAGLLFAWTCTLTAAAIEFAAPVNYPVGSHPLDIKAGDFNGDGIVDLATANSGRSVSVLLSNGDGTFQPARNTPISYYPSLLNVLAAGDFDRDGKLDLATSANDSSGIGFNVLLGRGDGTFVNKVQSFAISWSSSITTGDLNGDGKLDLVATAADPFEGTTFVDVLWGNGDGTFWYPYNQLYGPAEAYSPALAHFDGDNQLDLVLGGNFTTWVLLRNSDGSFQELRDLGLIAESLTVADLNADGKLDLATTRAVSLGNGNGSFQAAQSFDPGAGASAVRVADANGDGVLDLVLTTYQNAGGLSILLGHGDGSFGPPITFGGSYTAPLVTTDFNADGRTDAAVANHSSNTVTVLLNQSSSCANFVAPDLDRDCDVDAQDVVAFRACASRANVPVSSACQSRDFDGDGDVDVGDFGILQRCYGNLVPNCAH